MSLMFRKFNRTTNPRMNEPASNSNLSNSMPSTSELPMASPSLVFDPVHNAGRLLSHFSHLEDLLRLVRRTRHALPALVQEANNLPKSGAIESWNCLKQENLKNVQDLKEAIMNSQDAFLFVRSSSRLDETDFKIDDQMPDETAAAVAHMKKLAPRSLFQKHSDGSSGRISVPFALQTLQPGFEAAIKLINESYGLQAISWQEHITRPGRTSWVEVKVRGVLRALVTVREYPDPNNGSRSITRIERGVCFGVHEPRKHVYEQSDYGIFQSISRCLNTTIDEHPKRGSDNVYLVCTFLASYLDLFQPINPTLANPNQDNANPSKILYPQVWRIWRTAADDQAGQQTGGWDPMEEPR
ncbi:uncharacterized protein MELLADRAFT_68726 [Melampsora larici-populina 98AG31]|uniref:Uncharacterized protein n=1 Tax=Melampsora larici-populina (strain 98AG31 / pathotype 3-4-7) TaxID=747676 RepID=F4S7Z1_MELLP|nr:uncharacterized protein MELLADRAFT_68726 [Melampsora larici-populina 98AG31]EGF99193.1 hypothetical protein MELLADRAFT_68726 [Melampsora larici-populina 98AG31]